MSKHKVKKPVVKTENETRAHIINYIRLYKLGCEREMRMLFDKYDKLLRNCTNEQERSDIAKLGAYEVNVLLGGGTLTVDGQLVVE